MKYHYVLLPLTATTQLRVFSVPTTHCTHGCKPLPHMGVSPWNVAPCKVATVHLVSSNQHRREENHASFPVERYT